MSGPLLRASRALRARADRDSMNMREPNERARQRRQPTLDERHGAARHAVDPEQDELIEAEQYQHGERELRHGEHAQPKMELLGEINDDEQRERILAKQSARQRIERDAHPERRQQAELARRHQRPVEQHDGHPIGAQRLRRSPATARTRAPASRARLKHRHPPVATARPLLRHVRHARGGGLRGARRFVGRIPHEQHLTIAVERRRGLGQDLRERLVGPQLHVEHATDGVAGRETLRRVPTRSRGRPLRRRRCS